MKICSFEGCCHQAVFYNEQSVLLGRHETRQQFVFRVYHSCYRHRFYYAHSNGDDLYSQEKWLGWNRMFFLVLPQHIALARRLSIHWHDTGCGAPGASTTRPYGNSSYLDDIAEAIGYRLLTDEDGCSSPEEEKYLERLHREMHLVLQIILQTGQMKPGIYKKPRVSENWVHLEHPEDEPELVFALSENDMPSPQADQQRILAERIRQLREEE